MAKKSAGLCHCFASQYDPKANIPSAGAQCSAGDHSQHYCAHIAREFCSCQHLQILTNWGTEIYCSVDSVCVDLHQPYQFSVLPPVFNILLAKIGLQLNCRIFLLPVLLTRACFLMQCLSEPQVAAIKLSLQKTYQNHFGHLILNSPLEWNVALGDFLTSYVQILLFFVTVILASRPGLCSLALTLYFSPYLIFFSFLLTQYWFKLFSPA